MRQRYPYPKHIVPKRRYRLINISQETCLHDHFLIRYDTKDNPIPDAQTFDSIKKENFSKGYFNNGWSTSLLGVFTKEDVRFVLTKRGKDRLAKDWHHGDAVCSVRCSDYEYKVNRGYFGLLVKDVLNCTFDMDIFIGDKKDRTDKVHYDIRHEPTHNNFWHFSVYAYAVNSLNQEIYYLKDNLPTKNAAENATRNIADRLKGYHKLSFEVKRKKVPRGIYDRILG